jgi:hypothetical protein
MIPDLDLRMLENDGERRVYAALKGLPAGYTMMYSFKYGYMRPGTGSPEPDPERPESGDADFVVVHPSLGYLVLEVKQGKTGYSDGRWYEEKQGGQEPLSKDPVQQAQNAMYFILERWKEAAGIELFPLRIRYGLCFPECRHV